MKIIKNQLHVFVHYLVEFKDIDLSGAGKRIG